MTGNFARASVTLRTMRSLRAHKTSTRHEQRSRDCRRVEQSIASSSHGLFPVRLLDPVPVVGINVNDDDPSVARRDQRGLVEAGAAGLVGGFERRRLGKEQCALAAPQREQAGDDKQSGEYRRGQQKRLQPLVEERPIDIEEAK